jgi:hypothetical protein
VRHGKLDKRPRKKYSALALINANITSKKAYAVMA